MTRLVNEADIVNKTRPLFTLSLEMTRLVNETRLLLVPCVNSDIYSTSIPVNMKFRAASMFAIFIAALHKQGNLRNTLVIPAKFSSHLMSLASTVF